MVPPFQRRKAAEVLVEAVGQRRQFQLEPIGISLLSGNSVYGPVRLGGSGGNAVGIAQLARGSDRPRWLPWRSRAAWWVRWQMGRRRLNFSPPAALAEGLTGPISLPAIPARG